MHDPAVIREFHSRYYTPGNMTIIISGKIDQGTAGLLNRYFGGVTLAKGEQDEEGKPIIGEKTREVHIGKKEPSRLLSESVLLQLINVIPIIRGLRSSTHFLGGISDRGL